MVLTYNSPVALARCLASITRQTTAPAAILVVDNASDAALDDIVAAAPTARLLRLAENSGPAGGYATGLQEFLAGPWSWAWVMDDDCTVAPDALDAQLTDAAGATRIVMATMVDRATGANTDTLGWCGVLIPRAAVERGGVPNAELFWWNEDTEYLQWRMPAAGFALFRSTEARVEVSRARADTAKPAWKYYYEARNQVYYRLYTQRPEGTPVPGYLTRRVRLGRAARSVAKLAARAVTRESSGRVVKVAMVARGSWDGVRGRLGRTVAVDDSDRPL